ncbi:outer membrane protein assembly factor BamE [Thioclava pacifica]|uniref:outer membrane protein assembly factor BamE n=1 Tax=Thioclava pacifica TaxID=285109 RepID=UPI000AEC20D2
MGIGSMMRKAALMVAFGMVMLASACSPLYRNHGYVPIDEDLAQIQVGKSTRDDVATAIGRPSSTGVLEGSGWYYVGSRWKTVTWHAPKEISREVVAISFNDKGVVTNVERFGLEQGQVVTLSRRVTESNVKGISFIRQLLGSIGRVNAGQLLGGNN